MRMQGEMHALLKLATNYVRENLEFPVRMGAEACAGRDAVFIDHAQSTK